MHKYLAPFVIVVLVAAGIFTYAPRERTSPQAAVAVPVAALGAAAAIAAPTRVIPAAPKPIPVRLPAVAASLPAPVAKAIATLTIDGAVYPLSVTPGEKVIDAMHALTSKGTITFTGRGYPMLGYYIDSINGKKSASGNYWILYINGIPASVGASAMEVKAGDRVEWRYQKGY